MWPDRPLRGCDATTLSPPAVGRVSASGRGGKGHAGMATPSPSGDDEGARSGCGGDQQFGDTRGLLAEEPVVGSDLDDIGAD